MTSSSPTNSASDTGSKQASVSSFIPTHAGTLMKLGDGLMNRNWNPRYFVLRGSILQYFTNARDTRPKEVIDLMQAEITWLGEYMDRQFCIVVEPAAHRTLHLSGGSLEEAKQWMRWLQEAADPVSYSSLPPATGLGAFSPRAFQDGSDQVVSTLHLPKDLDPCFAEAAVELERAVMSLESASPDSASLSLVDVADSVRIFASGREKSVSDNKMVLYGLVGLLVALSVKSLAVPVLFLLAVVVVFERLRARSKRTSSDSAVAVATARLDVTPGGCKNYIFDASRYSSWMPLVSQAFVVPSSASSAPSSTVHYVINHKKHVGMRRTSWELSDGSLCVLGASGSEFEGWFVRRVDMSSKIVFLSSSLASVSATDRVRSVLCGLAQIASQAGDHDGTGVPRHPPSSWVRHWRGGIASFASAPIDIKSRTRQAVLFGKKKLVIKSPANGSDPLHAIASVFTGFSVLDHKSLDALVVVTAMVECMYRAAPAFAGAAWTRRHPKSGDSLLCWLGKGERAPQVFLEVTESSRANQGVAASIRVGITGNAWSLKGTIHYVLVVDGNGAMRLRFEDKSELEVVAAKTAVTLSLPDLVISDRVWWEGTLRVTEQHPSRTSSAVVRVSENGSVQGSVMDGNGRHLQPIHGHWLETLWIGSDLRWVFGTGNVVEVVLKKGSGEDLDVPSANKPVGVARMSSCDEEAMEFIGKLRNEIPELTAYANRFTDGCLYRFSKARQFKLDEVRTMLTAHIAWLKENAVAELLTGFEYPELPLVKAAFPHGYHGVDKMGRPIYISRLALANQDQLFKVTNQERFVKFWIQSYEDLLFKKIPVCEQRGGRNAVAPGVPAPPSFAPLQTLTILDMKGIGLGHLNAKVMDFLSLTNSLSANNYPEILGAMYLVNTPGMFPMLWSAVKGMIDPGTRSKIHVVSARQTREKLLEVIEADQLPFFLGGECKCNAAESDDKDTDWGCLSSDKGPWLA